MCFGNTRLNKIRQRETKFQDNKKKNGMYGLTVPMRIIVKLDFPCQTKCLMGKKLMTTDVLVKGVFSGALRKQKGNQNFHNYEGNESFTGNFRNREVKNPISDAYCNSQTILSPSKTVYAWRLFDVAHFRSGSPLIPSTWPQIKVNFTKLISHPSRQ